MFVIDHLSVSQLGTWCRCEFQWFLKYVEKLEYPINSAMVRGKAVHVGLAEIFNQLRTKHSYSREQVYALAVEYIELTGEKEEVEWKDSRDTIKDMVVRMLVSYIDNRFPDKVDPDDIEAVESQIIYSIFNPAGEEIKVVGYPDLVLKDRIIDFKTGSKRPNGIESEHRFQTAFYSTAINKQIIELQYLITKSNPEIVTRYAEIDDRIKADARNFFIKNYQKIKQALISGNFLPSGIFHPWACKTCGYALSGQCPYNHSKFDRLFLKT